MARLKEVPGLGFTGTIGDEEGGAIITTKTTVNRPITFIAVNTFWVHLPFWAPIKFMAVRMTTERAA
jgi:ABC-type glucose/galactose transport system permease subunit